MDEKERKKQYTAEVFTAAMVMGLGLFVVMFLQYLLRDAGGVLSLLLSFATFAVVVAVIDGGMGDNFASTVVDCTANGEVNIVRQGRQELEM